MCRRIVDGTAQKLTGKRRFRSPTSSVFERYPTGGIFERSPTGDVFLDVVDRSATSGIFMYSLRSTAPAAFFTDLRPAVFLIHLQPEALFLPATFFNRSPTFYDAGESDGGLPSDAAGGCISLS